MNKLFYLKIYIVFNQLASIIEDYFTHDML